MTDGVGQAIALVASDSVGLAGTLDLRVIVERRRPEVQLVTAADARRFP